MFWKYLKEFTVEWAFHPGIGLLYLLTPEITNLSSRNIRRKTFFVSGVQQDHVNILFSFDNSEKYNLSPPFPSSHS